MSENTLSTIPDPDGRPCPAWCSNEEHEADGLGARVTRGGDEAHGPHHRWVGATASAMYVALSQPIANRFDRDPRPVVVELDRVRVPVIDDGDPSSCPHFSLTSSEARSLAALLVKSADAWELDTH